MRVLLVVVSLLLVFVGCSRKPPVSEPIVSDGGILDALGTAQTAFVLSMWEESGAFGLIDTGSREPRAQLGPASNDAVARYFDGKIYIVNRLTHDNIQVMDATNWRLIKQYSVGTRSNPQDIAVLDQRKAYVSRLASTTLLIVAPLTGKQLGEVDLGGLAETSEKSCQQASECDAGVCLKGKCARDGVPELAQMHLYDGKLFVLVQRLDRNSRFAPKDKGMIAVIDTSTDTLIKTIPTAGSNPIQIVPVDGGKRIYVGQVGRWLDGAKPVLDGLIERFDLVAMKSEGVVLTEQALGGNLSSFTLASATAPTKGFAIRSNGKWQTELVSFDLTSGKVGDVLASSDCVAQGACFGFFQVARNDKGEIYLVDRHLKRPGIRIFDGSSGKELTRSPINMTLPPSSLLFFP